MLELSAQLVATLCMKYGIPPTRRSPDDLKVPGVRGICGHVDCTKATGVGSHWDPGPNFPWDWFMSRINAHVAMLHDPLAAVVPQPAHPPPSNALNEWPIVTLAGVRWSVAPSYVWPIGIGPAEDMAARVGCELPTPALVDAIFAAADLKLDPLTRSVDNGLLADWGPSMSSLATFADQAARVDAQVAGRSFDLVAGVCKDVVRAANGKPALYGWHTPAGHVIQPVYGGHARGWIDYSQGLRLCRRV